MKIATWNINGIKARLPNVLLWLEQNRPDIACLQEVKSTEEQFPRDKIENLGYHIEVFGQKSFNGVAILSKMPPEDVKRGLIMGDGQEDNQSRFIESVYSLKNRAVRVVSLYLPNGNPAWDNPEAQSADSISDKCAYKLRWMESLLAFSRKKIAAEEEFVLAGDFNIIPQAKDAANPEQWKNDALFLPMIKRKFYALINLGLTDAIRAVTDEDVYTFWDYQAGAWTKNNGIRIDHMLLSPQMAKNLRHAYIDKRMRSWEKPSDHVPVWIEIDD